MVHPLIPYAIRGAIWYQGEANANAGGGPRTGAWQYRHLFPTMIRDWRGRWGYDFPFAWVSLANYRPMAEEPGPSAWAELRESQTLTLSLPNTGEALAIDVGEARDIHPRDKQTVGHRLALWARDEVYGQKVVSSGPTFKSMEIVGDRVKVHFTDTADGLRRGVTENAPYPSPLVGFQIAGAEREWVWAEAQIRGDDEVVVWSDRVRQPVAVRYGWAANPAVNLYNSAGLPAVPFRTDRWPLSTEPAN
jgi:sialate O-acetylesterase